MFGLFHTPTTAVLIVCVLGGPCHGTLFASEADGGLAPQISPFQSVSNGVRVDRPTAVNEMGITLGDPSLARETLAAHAWRNTFHVVPVESANLAQRGGYYGRGRGRNEGAAAAIILGAAAAIAGTAVLVYANRPECSANQMASGCGYGTKVASSALIAGGLVGVTVGALTWR